MPRKIHFANPTKPHLTACGRPKKDMYVTNYKPQVTCGLCNAGITWVDYTKGVKK